MAGFVPDKVTTAPPVAVARLAEQLKVDPAEIHWYGKRAQTRTEHLRLVAQYLGWHPAGALELKELDEFLLARAMEHDSRAVETSPACRRAVMNSLTSTGSSRAGVTLLFRLACEYLISARVIRPGPDTVVRARPRRGAKASSAAGGCSECAAGLVQTC